MNIINDMDTNTIIADLQSRIQISESRITRLKELCGEAYEYIQNYGQPDDDPWFKNITERIKAEGIRT